MSENDRPPEEGEEPSEQGQGETPRESPAAEQARPPDSILPPCRTAEFPQGFWRRVDYLLHHPDEVMESLRQDKDLWEMSRVFFAISILMAALYGAVMGATNLLQGQEHMVFHEKLLMILITAIKVPILFLVTLVIVLPPVYVSNAFVGARLSFRQLTAILLSSSAITVTVLASMASVAFFFALTSQKYDFIKLLHVLFFGYAGFVGLGYLIKCIADVAIFVERREPNRPLRARRTPQWLFILWLLLYVFVGTQMAWVLRPFVGSPGMEFQVFRPRSGNFYESVVHSVGRLLAEEPDQQ